MPSGSESVQLATFWSNGTKTAVRQAVVRSYSYSRVASPRRVAPPKLVRNGTALSRSRWMLYDQVVDYHPPRSNAALQVILQQNTVGEHMSLGQGTDRVRYDTSLDAIVLNKLRSKLRNRSVNLANALGEYKQAAGLFADCAASISVMTLAALKRDPRILYRGYLNPYGKTRKGATGLAWVADVPKDIANLWLKYVYGVKPLMSDMHEAMEALRSRVQRDSPIMSARASSSIEQFQQGLFNSAVNGAITKCSVAEVSRKTVSGVAQVKLDNSLLNSSLGAYGFTNPLGVAWELTPYSFVIDWWINVGEVIESLDNPLYFDGPIWSQLTERYSYRRTVECLGGAGLYTTDTYSRRLPAVISGVSDFRLKFKPSAMHVANGVALLTSLLRK